MLWLVWSVDSVVMTRSRTTLQLCSGYICQNGSISRWPSRQFVCCTVLLHHIRPASPISPDIAEFVHCHHNCCKFCHSVVLLSRLRSFAAATALWNSLSLDIQSSPSLSVVCKWLKTFLFHKAFSIFYYDIFVLTVQHAHIITI